VDAIFLIFNKASDGISHNTLESKAGCYSLRGWTNRWIKHWLDDWTQGVVVNAGTKEITAGVCTRMCLDSDFVTGRRRGVALVSRLMLMPNLWGQ